MDKLLQNTQGLIFVVDSNNRDLFAEARYELHKLIQDNKLKDSVLLVFANKQIRENKKFVFQAKPQFNLAAGRICRIQ